MCVDQDDRIGFESFGQLLELVGDRAEQLRVRRLITRLQLRNVRIERSLQRRTLGQCDRLCPELTLPACLERGEHSLARFEVFGHALTNPVANAQCDNEYHHEEQRHGDERDGDRRLHQESRWAPFLLRHVPATRQYGRGHGASPNGRDSSTDAVPPAST